MMCNKTTAEFEIEVSNGQVRIIGENLPLLNEGRYKVAVKAITPEVEKQVSTAQDEAFVKVEASKLSIKDKFMKYKPKTDEEQNLKEMIEFAIKIGLKDFWRPKYDPSFTESCTGICYQSGKTPAVGKSYNWWEKVAKEFKPECKSRLGTKTEYIAFLAVLIKELVASGWEVSDAWHAVCNDSKKLGHYCNSENAKHKFEDTGCREICGFFDLSNTYKILAEDEETGVFWLAGGYCNYYSYYNPLADLYHSVNRDYDLYFSVGWLVLEECSIDH